jgi:hypothetical protein
MRCEVRSLLRPLSATAGAAEDQRRKQRDIAGSSVRTSRVANPYRFATAPISSPSLPFSPLVLRCSSGRAPGGRPCQLKAMETQGNQSAEPLGDALRTNNTH